MPALTIKVEGSGNGIKTVLTNIVDIASRIAREVDYPMKYFGNDIGANTKLEDNKWIMMGKHDRDRLQKSLFDYITRFVLCKSCRNPETRTLVDEKKNVWLRCGACGKENLVDPKEKLLNLIQKKEGVTYMEKEKGKKDKKEKKDKKDKKEKKSKDQREEERLDKETRQAGTDDQLNITPEEEEALRQRNPVEIVKEFLVEGKPTESEIIAKVADIKIEYGLNDKNTMRLLGDSLFTDENFSRKVRSYSGVLKRFVKAETEKYIIESMEQLVAEQHDKCSDKFPMALKKLYDEDVLSDETIFTWYDGKPMKDCKEFSKENREKSKPVVDWLKEDEEDD